MQVSARRPHDKQNKIHQTAPAKTLEAAVKSAILDRLLQDLRTEAGRAPPHSRYTKSDSGLYGKYEKQDGLDQNVLDAIRSTLQAIVEEQSARSRDPTEPSSGE
jgi:hypothetical protein